VKRWDTETHAQSEFPKIDAFIDDVIEVCKKHGFSISHEDHQGAFLIEAVDERNFEWLRGAQRSRGCPR
jgi:hypothetical protein